MTGDINILEQSSVPSEVLLCDGRLLELADYPDLFDVIGTSFGGDGETTFALPTYSEIGGGWGFYITAFVTISE